METWLLALLAVANLVAFALMGLDKAAARRGARRVPEWTLALGATPFGVGGTVLGMLAFRHKTRKPAFWAKVLVATGLAALLALGGRAARLV